jgi:hypothetical protein
VDVRLNLEGEHGQITAEALRDALADLLDLLDEAAGVVGTEQQQWRIQALGASSAHVAVSAPEGPAVALMLARGLDGNPLKPWRPDFVASRHLLAPLPRSCDRAFARSRGQGWPEATRRAWP